MIVAILISIIITAVLSILLVGYCVSGPRYKGPITDHFNGKRFYNYGDPSQRTFMDLAKWMLTRKRKAWRFIDDSPGRVPTTSVNDSIRLTFVNHSTFLIQCDGVNILTDPIWSERASPFHWMGPKRMRRPGITLQDLPTIHFVLVSHNHYDHLDVVTLQKLRDAFNPKVIVPLGVRELLSKYSINNVVELDWWNSTDLSDSIRVDVVPAHHSTARGTIDRDKSLWCGFVLSTRKGKIFFAGDTGYDKSTFISIGKKYGPLRISILPIGAYKPEWFMAPVHCSPAGAVEIHIDIQSEQSIASHFGTFPLADDGQLEPIEELERSLNEKQIQNEKFIVPSEGKPMDFH